MISREFRENAAIQSYVAGFLDDDISKTGKKIHGIPVLGKIDDLERIAEAVHAEDVIIAIPSVGSDRMRHIVSLCRKAEVNFKTVPDLGELIDGKISTTSIREVEYRDLLGRQPVKLDRAEIGNYLGGRCVLMLEEYPWKAVENNIFGTRNVVEAADRFKCSKFVFVSTDKAVNPFSVMGASKRAAEMIVQNQNLVAGSQTSFITVRFGNVIGSVGSVIPLFKKQISDGGPVTVTHLDMVRYFMLIPEACQLILQAGAMGKGCEIFILDMGKPVKIDNMARELIRFSGFEPDMDIKIEYTVSLANEIRGLLDNER